eukprot:307013_1
MALSFNDVQAILLLSISCLINYPLSVYCGYVLYRNWNEQWLIKRRRGMIMILYCLAIWNPLITFPFYAIRQLTYKIDYTFSIPYLLGFTIRHFIVGLLILRIFILYFDHEFNRILSMKKWKMLINPKVVENNWFLVNRHNSYGDHIWMIKFIYSPIVSFCCIIFILFHFIFIHYFGIQIEMFVDYTLFFIYLMISVCFGYLCWQKYPKFHDTLLIRLEIKYLIIILFSGAIIMVSSVLIVRITINHEIGAGLIGVSVINIMYAVSMYIAIIYPQRLVHHKGNSDNGIAHKLQTITQKQLSWNQSIVTTEGYESFANFLEKEFSIENLLFVSEYVQLKQSMNNNATLGKKIKQQETLYYDLELPSSVPLSIISLEFQDKMQCINTVNTGDVECKLSEICFDSLNRLFFKYIDSASASLEVNLSWDKRKNLIYHFENKPVLMSDSDIIKILECMEEAVMEISYLMSDSMMRFKETASFQEIMEIVSVSR